ncbi:hypothetical protein [Hymenobacter aquaticus]|nr:hypothetical protein [Hymenobacter aquaticus]
MILSQFVTIEVGERLLFQYLAWKLGHFGAAQAGGVVGGRAG